MNEAYLHGYFKGAQDNDWQAGLKKFYTDNRDAVNAAGGGLLGGLLYLLSGGRGLLGGLASSGAGAGVGYFLGQAEPTPPKEPGTPGKSKEESGKSGAPFATKEHYENYLRDAASTPAAESMYSWINPVEAYKRLAYIPSAVGDTVGEAARAYDKSTWGIGRLAPRVAEGRERIKAILSGLVMAGRNDEARRLYNAFKDTSLKDMSPPK